MTWEQRVIASATVLGLLLTADGVLAQSAPFKDCSDCPEMVLVPPGSFTMGVPPGEEERENIPKPDRGYSVPQHQVTIREGFSLSKYAVTRGEFTVFARETDFRISDKCQVFGLDKTDNHWKFTEQSGHSWRNPGFAQTERDPAVCLSWDDAKAYVAWLGRKSGKPYRLPSEAEWEYAARAGSPNARFWGDDRSQACRYGNVADNTFYGSLRPYYVEDPEYSFNCSDGFIYTAPVGSFQPNAFGLYDMLGNAWQWVEDCVSPRYQGAPTDGKAWLAGDCSRRIIRGAAWGEDPRMVRVGMRRANYVWYRSSAGGFRVARTL